MLMDTNMDFATIIDDEKKKKKKLMLEDIKVSLRMKYWYRTRIY